MSTADLSRMGVICRPIDSWPGEFTKARKPSPFRAAWDDTVILLADELRHLSAKSISLLVAVEQRDICVDGSRPKAGARAAHPGVIIAFDSKHGPMKIACDRFMRWEDNIRAIALGLGDLRRLDRYGITKRGEQYRGWRQLTGPAGPEPLFGTPEEAAAWLGEFMGTSTAVLLDNRFNFEAIVTRAIKAHHPDVGGSTENFKKVMDARRVLMQHHGIAR